MSVHDTHEKEFKGFYKIFWNVREHPYYNKRMSPANKSFARYCGRHKKSGASYLCSLKQFDVKRVRVFNKFKSRKCIPYDLAMPSGQWGFGRGGNKELAFNTKFMY